MASKSRVEVIEALTGPITLGMSLIAIVVMAIWTDGSFIGEVIAFSAGVLVPMRYRGGGGTGAAAAVLAIAIGAAALSGCGASPLEMSARVATALDEVSAQSARTLRAERMAAMERRALEVQARGGTEAEALEVAIEEGTAWMEAVDVHASFDRMVRIFARGSRAAIDGEASLEVALPTLIDAAAIYGRLVAMVERRGSTALPPLPAMVLQWIESMAPAPAPEGAATP